MAVPKETHLERLLAAERILFRKLSDIKTKVECGGIVWQPPGWGMEYWKKGLRFQLTGGGVPKHFKELDTDDLREMMEKFDKFVEYVKEQQGLDIEPPPVPPGPGVGHYFKSAVSKHYRRECAEVAKEEKVRNALEQLRVTRDEAREALDAMELKEKEIIRQGRAQKSTEIKKRLAAKLAALRKEISRESSTVQFAGRQLGRCEDFLHTRKIIRLAGATGLPNTEETVENQVEAEQAIEAAEAAAEAASSIEFDYGMDEETQACLAEFEDDPVAADSDAEADDAETDDAETDDADTEMDQASTKALGEFDIVDGDDDDDGADDKADDKAKHTA